MDSQAREICSLIAEIGFALAGFSVVAMALRSPQNDEWPAAARFRAHGLLFSSLSAGLLALLALGLSASGTASDIIYRVVSALYLAASGSFSVFAFRLNRAVTEVSERSMFRGSSGFMVIAFLPVAGLQAVNATVLGLFWPVFAALLFQLITAANAFYRLVFLGTR